MNRVHCSTCQRQLLQRTLVDRAAASGSNNCSSSMGAISVMPAAPSKKQSAGGKVAHAVAGEMLNQAVGFAVTAAAGAVGCTIM